MGMSQKQNKTEPEKRQITPPKYLDVPSGATVILTGEKQLNFCAPST